SQQDGVSVRETTEALNNVAVMMGPVGTIRRVLLVDSDGVVLVGLVLRVHEGQTTKYAQYRVDMLHVAGLDQMTCVVPRQGVGGIHMRRTPKAIAGKLVRQDNERQARFGLTHPVLA